MKLSAIGSEQSSDLVISKGDGDHWILVCSGWENHCNVLSFASIADGNIEKSMKEAPLSTKTSHYKWEKQVGCVSFKKFQSKARTWRFIRCQKISKQQKCQNYENQANEHLWIYSEIKISHFISSSKHSTSNFGKSFRPTPWWEKRGREDSDPNGIG